jgi:drug/metabolite transporter (DMT)-like permease
MERSVGQYAVLMAGVVAVSWSAILIRETAAPALVIGSYRLVLAGLPMGALAVVQQRRSPERAATGVVGPMVLSAVFLAAHFAFWIESLKHTSVVTSVVLVAAQPLYVALLSPFLLHEKVERRVWYAIAIASFGALVMASEDLRSGFGTVLGDLYAMLGGAMSAAYIMVGRRVRPEVSWPRYVGIVYPITAVMLVALTIVAGDSFTGYTMKAYVMMALLALGPQLIGHTSINWSLAHFSAVIVSIAILLEPVITTGLAIPILKEVPTPIETVGAALVLVGVYVALRPEAHARLAVEVSAAD